MIHSVLRDTAREIANVDINRLPNAILTAYLNAAQDEIMLLNRLRFGESFFTTAFTPDTQTISPAPTGNGTVAYITRLWYLGSSGEQVDVHPLGWNEYVDHYGTAIASGGTADPVHFAQYEEDSNGNPIFWLGPSPDRAITAYITARIKMPALAVDADENPLTVQAPLAVIYRALIFASPYLENADRIPEWEKEYQMFVKLLTLAHAGGKYSAKHANGMQEPG